MQQNLERANSRASELESQIAALQTQDTTVRDNELEDQVEKLRRDLAEAQQDANTLRSSASIAASMVNVQGQEGSPSISEQIAGQVEAIRAELNARHDERVQQEELKFKKRADTMRAQLSSKLKEKEIARDAMINEHAQALEDLKVQHREEIHALEARHQDELDELKRNEKSKAEHSTQDASGQDATTNGIEEVKKESQMTSSDDLPNLTESQIKHLLSTNDTVRSIVRRNIVNALAKEKESLIAQVKDEEQIKCADALADADSKAKDSREQAVLMEGKKYLVKMSMADNKAKTAQFKLDYVEKASNETPQKPVIEVWQIAKTMKPEPVMSRQPQQSHQQSESQPQLSMQGQGSSQSTVFGKPTPSATSQSPAAQGIFGKPTTLGGQTRGPSAPQVGSIPEPAGSPMQANSPSMQTPSEPAQQTNKNDGHTDSSENSQQPLRLPDKPLQSQGTQRPNVGTGVAALKNLQSGLPVPNGGRGGGRGGPNPSNSYTPHASTQSQGSQPNRGGTNIRGRGRGNSRSGSLNFSAQGPHSGQQGQSSPTSGNSLNAAARQFVPGGNKRPREDGQDAGGEVGNGKRIRGGGQGT